MNIFKSSAALFAAVAIISCNEKITTDTGEGGLITVTSQIGTDTKSGYDIYNLPGEFTMDIDQSGSEYDYALQNMVKKGDENVYFSNSAILRWASMDHSGVQVKAMTVSSSDINKTTGEINITISENQSSDESLKPNDILGASTSKNNIFIDGDNIIVFFSHLMSKLHVVYEVAEGSTASIEHINLQNVSMGGVYDYQNMQYGSSLPIGNEIIRMCHNTDYKSAEAVFYPFTIQNDKQPTLLVRLSGRNTDITVPLNLATGFEFKGGKNYVIKLKISNRNAEIVSVSQNSDWVKNVGGKILWIGTSIPAGSGANNYPKMIADATGLEIVNNAIGGSKVLECPDDTWFTSKDTWNYLMAGGLAQTTDDAEANYKIKLSQVSDGDTDWVNAQIQTIQSLSYQSLIEPYIDGRLDNCKVVVIDHGFNDIVGPNQINGIGWEAGSWPGGEGEDVWGEEFLNALTADNYQTAYKNFVINSENLTEEGSYLLSIEKIVNAIRDVERRQNTSIKIIIGNYFAYDSPWGRANWYGGGFSNLNFAGTLCCYNKAAARVFGLDIVNVYDKIDIPDWYRFCPDGVHPSSDATGNSNITIAYAYIDEFRRIFGGNSKTKSTASTSDCGWEDVELF